MEFCHPGFIPSPHSWSSKGCGGREVKSWTLPSFQREAGKLKLRKRNDLDTVFLVAAVSRGLKAPTHHGREIVTWEAIVIDNLIAKGRLQKSSLVFSPRFLTDKRPFKSPQLAAHKQNSRWKEMWSLANPVLIKPVYVLLEWMSACLPGNPANLGSNCRYLNFVLALLCYSCCLG